MAAKIYDTRTLYLITGPCNRSQILHLMGQLSRSFEQQTGIKANYEVNVPTSWDGKPRRCAYVFVSTSSFYHALLGKNTDGTARVERIPDPEWKPVQKSLEQIREEMFGSGASKSWADDEDDDFGPPMIEKKLAPLLTIPPIKLTEEQKKWMIENEPDSEPNTYTVEFYGAFVSPPEPCIVPNILVCRGLQPWITVNDLRRIYGNFVKDRSHDQVQVQIRKKIALITYPANTTDAAFALLMTKKREYARDGQSVQLVTTQFSNERQHHDN